MTSNLRESNLTYRSLKGGFCMTNNILNNIDTKEVWIDVETVAKLKDITKRAVRLSLSNDRYEYKVETVKGGKTYKIKLSSLEENFQVKYIQEYYNDFKTIDNEIIELSNFNIKQEKLISESQKKIALAKYDLISCWLNYRKDFKKQKFAIGTNPDTQFLELYNTGILYEEIFKTLGKTSIGSLYRWRALLNYNSDWTALVGQYKYSTRKEYHTTLNEEQIKIFLKILLSPNSFSIGKSISLEELGFTGVYEKLGIKPIYATPYNARAKVIERFFLDFQEGFEKLMPSYIGTSIENKPAYLKRNEKLHKQIHENNNFTPTIEQAIKLIDKWLEFKNSQTCPNDKTKTIKEVLEEVEKQNIIESNLDDLMMAMEIKNIGRNGIRFLKADYFDEALYGIKEKAIIKYSLFDLSYIKVYSLKGEFICKANRVTSTHPLANQMLELSIQLGEDTKVDYNPIDRLVGIYNDLIDKKLLTVKEYADATNEKTSEIEKKIELANLMVDYLDYINAPLQFYIARENDIEGPLHEILRALHKCKTEDEADYVKQRLFSELLMRPEGDMTRYIRKTADNIVSSKYAETFKEETFECIEEIQRELLAPENKNLDKKELINKVRNNSNVKEKMQKSRTKLIERNDREKIKNEPVELLNKSIDIVEHIDTNIFKKLSDDQLDDVKQSLSRLENIVNSIRVSLED